MSDKKFPIWLISGLIVLGIFLIIAILDFSMLCKFGNNFGEGCGFFLIIASLPIMPITMLLPAGYFWYIGTIVISGILYFLLGALIGKIISKIKNR